MEIILNSDIACLAYDAISNSIVSIWKKNSGTDVFHQVISSETEALQKFKAGGFIYDLSLNHTFIPAYNEILQYRCQHHILQRQIKKVISINPQASSLSLIQMPAPCDNISLYQVSDLISAQALMLNLHHELLAS
ncbi:MAG: hypothetical protein JJU28_08850 [Cyclobacteriaceae bacterium]|nr:hypothetical protein [Cyclobacteriaceae bacterium]